MRKMLFCPKKNSSRIQTQGSKAALNNKDILSLFLGTNLLFRLQFSIFPVPHKHNSNVPIFTVSSSFLSTYTNTTGTRPRPPEPRKLSFPLRHLPSPTFIWFSTLSRSLVCLVMLSLLLFCPNQSNNVCCNLVMYINYIVRKGMFFMFLDPALNFCHSN